MTAVYLDYAATSPMPLPVWEAMEPYYRESFGNPSSIHAFGRAAQTALGRSRDALAGCIGCSPGEIVFTGGGTESDNTALFGLAESYGKHKKHIITTAVEHHAVLHACRRLQDFGFDVTYLPADEHGQVSAEDAAAAIRGDTLLISVMFGNNEVGTLQPIEAIGRLARAKGIWMHTDAVQAFGHAPIDCRQLPVDLLSLSAHKLGGPKGVGLLYVSERVRLSPMLYGGSQERNKRAGTENVAGIVGFARAAELAVREMAARKEHDKRMRRVLLETLARELGEDGFKVNGHPQETLPHILNVSFPGIRSETLLMNLDLAGIAASSGSACSSGSLEPSHVLQAMGLPEDRLDSAVRFSFGPGLTEEAVRQAASSAATIAARLRNTHRARKS